MKLLNVIDKEMVDSVGEHVPPLYVVQCVCVCTRCVTICAETSYLSDMGS